jgi:hypothetical protein
MANMHGYSASTDLSIVSRFRQLFDKSVLFGLSQLDKFGSHD